MPVADRCRPFQPRAQWSPPPPPPPRKLVGASESPDDAQRGWFPREAFIEALGRLPDFQPSMTA